MTNSVAVSGDTIINRRLSVLNDPGLEEVASIFSDADVGFTHFETLIHNFNEEGVYAPAEPGEMAMRSPEFVVEELEWLGIDLVSHASNHALDYGYGGLRETWAAFDRANVPCAGTGEDLSEARGPVFLDTELGRVALISMTTSFTPWSRAGAARYDHRGRPGLNPLGFHYTVGPDELETIKSVAKSLGLWITELQDGEWVLNPPGLHNTLTRFVVDDEPGFGLAVDERDRQGNLRTIKDASRQADFVITHIHTHAWDPDGTLAEPPDFIEAFARDCVDAGANLVVGQGSHAPLRGVEIYNGSPIFYDPGDLVMMIEGVSKQPMEFYERFEHNLDVDPRTASISDVYDSRPAGFNNAENPPGGYTSMDIGGFVVPVCEFDDDLSLEKVRLHPGKLRQGKTAYSGVPRPASDEESREIVEYLDELSTEYETTIDYEDGMGIITP